MDNLDDLDPEVRKWLIGLRERDLEELTDALEAVRLVRNAGRLMRVFWVTLVALAMGAFYLMDDFKKLFYPGGH